MTQVRPLMLVALAIAAFAGLAAAAPATAQTPSAQSEAFEGTVPVPGGTGVVSASAGATPEDVVDALRRQACEPSVIALQGERDWAMYRPDAPAFVNDRFPASLEADSPLLIRCRSEIEVEVPHGDIVLAGTLTLPPMPPPYPATILVSGSGPQDRDSSIESIPGYEPFEWIAEHLQGEGVAVLRYDDRGVAESTGQQVGATSEDFAGDAEAVFEFLGRQPGIDPERVGITGHSEGGMIAGMVAASNPDVAFVISLAGPALPGEEIIELQSVAILEAQNAPPEVVIEELEQGVRIRELTIAGEWDELERLIRAEVEEQIATLPEEEAAAVDVDELVERELLNAQTWVRFYLTYDPAEDYAQVNVPVLAIFGELDVQVPAEENIAALQEALDTAGNEDVTIMTLPDANHLFQPAVTGAPGEYAELPMEFVPGFLDTLSEWLLLRFGTAP